MYGFCATIISFGSLYLFWIYFWGGQQDIENPEQNFSSSTYKIALGAPYFLIVGREAQFLVECSSLFTTGFCTHVSEGSISVELKNVNVKNIRSVDYLSFEESLGRVPITNISPTEITGPAEESEERELSNTKKIDLEIYIIGQKHDDPKQKRDEKDFVKLAENKRINLFKEVNYYSKEMCVDLALDAEQFKKCYPCHEWFLPLEDPVLRSLIDINKLICDKRFSPKKTGYAVSFPIAGAYSLFSKDDAEQPELIKFFGSSFTSMPDDLEKIKLPHLQYLSKILRAKVKLDDRYKDHLPEYHCLLNKFDGSSNIQESLIAEDCDSFKLTAKGLGLIEGVGHYMGRLRDIAFASSVETKIKAKGGKSKVPIILIMGAAHVNGVKTILDKSFGKVIAWNSMKVTAQLKCREGCCCNKYIEHIGPNFDGFQDNIAVGNKLTELKKLERDSEKLTTDWY